MTSPIIFIISIGLVSISLTLANPCPCQLVLPDSAVSTIASTSNSETPLNQYFDDDSLEEYIQQLAATMSLTPDNEQDFNEIYQQKPFISSARRSKRPSWATVGKRAAILIKKRPSWAQVG